MFLTNNAILIWDYNHLPEEIKTFMEIHDVSRDDLDWIALKPMIYKDKFINWLEEPAFGCCDVSEIPFSNEYIMVLGYHA